MFKNRASLRSRILSIAVASALGVAGTAMAAVPAGGQFNVLTKATQLHRGDKVKGVVPINKDIRISVVLKLRNDAGMEAFISKPGSSRMSQAQLQRHLPTRAQAQAVAAYLRQAGLRNVDISSNRMIVNATGNAAAIQSAFKTSLVSVHTHDGRTAFANNSAIQIPASLRGSVQAVLGLQTVHKAHTLARTHAQPGVNGHFPLEFADIYDASSLPPATDIHTAVWGWGSMENSVNNLNDFTAINGLDPVNIMVVCTDYAGNDGVISTTDPTCGGFDQGEIEWSMDSQSIIGMSGGVASLTFYAAYGAYTDQLTDSLNEIISPTAGEPLAQVINASFGICERFVDANQGGDGSAQVWDALFQIAASQGQTFSVSTGDSGADNCGFDDPKNSASSPADDPWVVAASGTTLRATTTDWARENVWRASGGSPSSVFAAQPWQAPLQYSSYAGARGPDVAFDGNPASGALVLASGSFFQVGGTSLSAPLFAGAWARILQGNPDLGFAAPHLYTLSSDALHDVRSGNNNGWVARRGWDWVSGLGSLDVDTAAAELASSGGGCALENGVPVADLSGAVDEQINCSVAIPVGASNLVITISGGSGDADLYVKFGAPPTLSDYDCRPFLFGNDETCTFPAPSTGTYYVMINAFDAFSGVTLEATWD